MSEEKEDLVPCAVLSVRTLCGAFVEKLPYLPVVLHRLVALYTSDAACHIPTGFLEQHNPYRLRSAYCRVHYLDLGCETLMPGSARDGLLHFQHFPSINPKRDCLFGEIPGIVHPTLPISDELAELIARTRYYGHMYQSAKNELLAQPIAASPAITSQVEAEELSAIYDHLDALFKTHTAQLDPSRQAASTL